MKIFGDNAQKYWDAGLPAIPLLARQKRPAVMAWANYCKQMPTEDEQRIWLEHFSDGNIGLALGPCSGMIAVDIDTDDPKVMRILDQVLPQTPWRRYGRKGEVRMFRYGGQPTQRLIATGVGTVCEFLSVGTQVVLPPSIHPDTGTHYYATGDLWDYGTAGLPELPHNCVDLIRGLLVDAGFDVGTGRVQKTLSFVPVGTRDNAMVHHAGLLARLVTRGERNLKQALGEIEVWCQNYVEQVEGDPLDPAKAQKKVVEFLIRDVTGVLQKPLPPGWDDDLSDEDKEKLGVADFGEDVEIWPVGKILEDAAVGFASAENEDAVFDVINKALLRASRAGKSLSALDEERLLKTLVGQSRGTLTVGAVRKQLKEMRKGDIVGDDHNEIAQAVKAHIDEFGELRFHNGFFWQWNGAHWKVFEESEIVRIVSEEFGKFPVCKRQSDYVAIVKLLRDTAKKDLLAVNFTGVNFANGFLTEDLELVAHQPDFGQMYVLPYRYRPEVAGDFPMFQAFMDTSWKHCVDYEEKMKALQEAIGVTLFGKATQFQRVFCFYGQAQSGKSTMSQIVRDLLPPEGLSVISPQDWSDKFLPAEMYGKVINFAGELSERKLIDGEWFKRVVEGEMIPAQRKGQQPFMFRPKCAHFFNSNHLPKSSDGSDGFNRRWLFIEWDRKVPDHLKVPGLAAMISESEREAIAAWAVLGYSRMKTQGDYTISASHQSLVGQMATGNNTVRNFLAHSLRLEMGTKNELSFMDLYNEYRGFCMASGIVKLASSNGFEQAMRDLANTFNFQVVEQKARQGGREVLFRGITIVK